MRTTLWLAGIAFALFLLPGVDAGASASPPATRIRLPTSIMAPCLAVNADGTVLRIPQHLFADLVAARPAGKWRTEVECMALIHGNRARLLLATPPLGTDSRGCRQISLRDVDPDALFLLAKLLAEGKVVVEAKSKGFEPVIELHRDNPDCAHGPSGGEWFSLPRGKPFLSVTTCVA